MKGAWQILREQEVGDGGDGSAGAGGAGEASSSGDSGSADGGAASKQEITADNWQSFISEDLRKNESLSKFTTLEGLAKSYINAESMIGRDKIVIPKTDEEYESVYNTLGRPESPDAYKIKTEGELSKPFLETAHKLGFNDKQAQGIVDWYNEFASKSKEEQTSSMELAKSQVESELKETWGEKYKGNFTLAKRFLDDQADEDFLDYLEESKLGNDPRMIKFLHKVAIQSGEDNLEDGHNVDAQTPEQLKDEINEMMANPAYSDRGNPNHQAVVRKVESLFKRLHQPAA